MERLEVWYLVIGGLFVLLGLLYSRLKDLPITTSLVYLGTGYAMSQGLELLRFDPLEQTEILEVLAELAVIISLFSAGLKLPFSLRDPRWLLPIMLATVSMAITVALVSVVGVYALGLPLGAAILLGGVLAPTDPVLASEVQVRDTEDEDLVRRGLTGEAGLNDGAAFPFVMLGLGLLGAHDLGAWGWRWWVFDVLWAGAGGLAIGAALGHGMGVLLQYLRVHCREALGAEEFLTLGLLAVAYGAGLAAGAYAFLSVFAAAVFVRRHEQRSETPADGMPHIAEELLELNEVAERLAEAVVMVLVGVILASFGLAWELVWFLPVLFLVIRPLGVYAGLPGLKIRPGQRLLLAWFGIRGVGSVYYLAYAMNHGLPENLWQPLTSLVLLVVTGSVVVHGLTGTPIMGRYGAKQPRPEPA